MLDRHDWLEGEPPHGLLQRLVVGAGERAEDGAPLHIGEPGGEAPEEAVALARDPHVCVLDGQAGRGVEDDRGDRARRPAGDDALGLLRAVLDLRLRGRVQLRLDPDDPLPQAEGVHDVEPRLALLHQGRRGGGADVQHGERERGDGLALPVLLAQLDAGAGDRLPLLVLDAHHQARSGAEDDLDAAVGPAGLLRHPGVTAGPTGGGHRGAQLADPDHLEGPVLGRHVRRLKDAHGRQHAGHAGADLRARDGLTQLVDDPPGHATADLEVQLADRLLLLTHGEGGDDRGDVAWLVDASAHRGERHPLQAERPVLCRGRGGDREALHVRHEEVGELNPEGLPPIRPGDHALLAQVEDARPLQGDLGDRGDPHPRPGYRLSVLVVDGARHRPAAGEHDVPHVREPTGLEPVLHDSERGAAPAAVDGEGVQPVRDGTGDEEAPLGIGERLARGQVRVPHRGELRLEERAQVSLQELDSDGDDRGPVLLDDAPCHPGEVFRPRVIDHRRVRRARLDRVAATKLRRALGGDRKFDLRVRFGRGLTLHIATDLDRHLRRGASEKEVGAQRSGEGDGDEQQVPEGHGCREGLGRRCGRRRGLGFMRSLTRLFP